MGIQSKRKYSSDKTTHSKRATTSSMRQLSLLLLLSVAMLCSVEQAIAKSCSNHWDCATTQACSQRKCVDLCFSSNCNKAVNDARDRRGWTPLHIAAYSRNSVGVTKQL